MITGQIKTATNYIFTPSTSTTNKAMGKVITTHLVDGNPRGIRNVFISNKICNMHVIPRQQINEANANPDIQLEQPAFYILLGGEDDFASMPQAYIGQTENFKDRVKSHEAKKEFWNTALVFIAKDNSLTKADVQFIEAKAIRTAKKAKSYQLSENDSLILQSIDDNILGSPETFVKSY